MKKISRERGKTILDAIEGKQGVMLKNVDDASLFGVFKALRDRAPGPVMMAEEFNARTRQGLLELYDVTVGASGGVAVSMRARRISFKEWGLIAGAAAVLAAVVLFLFVLMPVRPAAVLEVEKGVVKVTDRAGVSREGKTGAKVAPGDTVETSRETLASLKFKRDGVCRLNQNQESIVALNRYEAGEISLKQETGDTYNRVNEDTSFTITCDDTYVDARDAAFVLREKNNEERMVVLHNRIKVFVWGRQYTVKAGYMAWTEMRGGKKILIIRPFDTSIGLDLEWIRWNLEQDKGKPVDLDIKRKIQKGAGQPSSGEVHSAPAGQSQQQPAASSNQAQKVPESSKQPVAIQPATSSPPQTSDQAPSPAAKNTKPQPVQTTQPRVTTQPTGSKASAGPTVIAQPDPIPLPLQIEQPEHISLPPQIDTNPKHNTGPKIKK